MIAPAESDMRVARNGVYRERLFFIDTGAPVDLSGWGARMQVRRYPGETGNPLIDIGTAIVTPNGSMIAVADATGGILEIFIAKPDLAALPEGADPPRPQTILVYDLVLTEPGGDDNVYLKGRFVVEEGVTR